MSYPFNLLQCMLMYTQKARACMMCILSCSKETGRGVFFGTVGKAASTAPTGKLQTQRVIKKPPTSWGGISPFHYVYRSSGGELSVGASPRRAKPTTKTRANGVRCILKDNILSRKRKVPDQNHRGLVDHSPATYPRQGPSGVIFCLGDGINHHVCGRCVSRSRPEGMPCIQRHVL